MLLDALRPHAAPPSDLPGLIRQVRRRWRLKMALRGAAAVAVCALALFLAGAWAMEWARFSPASILTLRIVMAVAVAASAGWFFVRPLLRRVSDEQVALYLEEHEPTLQAAVVSAVEASRHAGGASPSTSAALVRRLVEQAIERCAAVDAARRLDREPLRRYGAALAAVAVVAVAAFLLGPSFIRHAASALLLLSRSVEAAAPYRIDVAPGDATVPRGADQPITARLHGFAAEEASVLVRRGAAGTFEPLPLVRGDDGQYEGMLFDLPGSADYFVEADGVRSRVFTLKVVDLPYVERLELEYRFPPYTGLPPEIVEDGGDIAVLRGTQVGVRVIPTMAAPGGRVMLHEKESVPLERGADGVLTASFAVQRDGFYRVELDAPTGERVAASPQFTIDALSDGAPAVSFSRPGRDTMASPIEEVFVEANAEDDYGIRNLELVYSVNGGKETTITLFGGRNRLPEVTAGHTFYLEELELQPGDSVSYFARASDNDAVGGAKRATSDLYFLRIRPFRKDFREAPSMAGGGGGGGGEPVDALSEQQRQIISATFNVQRDRRTYSADRLREHTTVVALSQARLREQVEGLVTRMESRLIEPDPSFQKIGELLPQAVEAMKEAESKLGAASPDAALPPEHRALKLLQQAEEEYETQVSMSRGGGGGGGSGSTMAQELADLFELELDRMANQYETADRALQQSGDQQLDALLEKLKELARRQEQEAERQRRRAAAGQSSGGGSSGASQRALAEEAEEAARRLERLSREQNRPDLADAARRMQEAADAMRRAAASGDAKAAGEAAAALGRLRDTERRLQEARAARAERDVQDAKRQAAQLAREQQEIADAVRGMSADPDARREQARELSARKDDLESRLAALERQLDRGAADAGRDEREAARKLADAAAGIRDNRLRDKIRYSKAMVSGRVSGDALDTMEKDIALGFDALNRTLDEAASALGQSKPEPGAEALERARRLARGMESMQERIRERAQGDRGEQRVDDGQDARGAEPSQQGSEGEGSQQGAQGAEGNADGRGGAGDTAGPLGGAGGFGDRRPRGFTNDEVRQFRGEMRQWRGEAQELRQLLRDGDVGDVDPKQLDELLRSLRALDDPRVYQNVEELRRLQAAATEQMKRLEYALRVQAEIAGEAALAGAEDVPEAFRPLVEQYYRSLAKTPPK